MSHKVFERIERPDPALVERYRAVLTDRLAHAVAPDQLMDSAIKPLLGRNVHIVGPAVTVASSHPDFMLGILATGVAQPGDVIVIGVDHHDAGAAWGAGLTISADIVGCAGVVVDGLVIDARKMLECATPVFCRGSTMKTRPNDAHGSVNVDVRCGGVTVRPGDLIVGDLDGVCVVTARDAAQLIDALEAASRTILAGAASMIETRSTIFDRMGGKALAEKLGIDWV